MANGFVCYHHCNDPHGHPASATCSNCGKALCRECVDVFRSTVDGSILCGECQKNELAQCHLLLKNKKTAIKKELIGMGVGAVIGIILAAILNSATGGYIWLLPFVMASVLMVWKMVRSHNWGFIVGFIVFVVFIAVSPIVLLYRIVVRVKNIAAIKKISATYEHVYANVTNYIKNAEAVTGEDPAEPYLRALRASEAKQKELENQINALKAQKTEGSGATDTDAKINAVLAELSKVKTEAAQAKDAANNATAQSIQAQKDAKNAMSRVDDMKTVLNGIAN